MVNATFYLSCIAMGLVYIVYGVTGLQKHGRAQKLKPMVVKQIPINDFDKA